MDQRRRYRNPPVEEAICEFRFVSDAGWDLTIPGRLQVALIDQYCGKSREQRAVRVGLHVGEGKPPNLEYNEGLARVHLVANEGTRTVGVGPDVLSVHILRPYQNNLNLEKGGWEEFQRRIATALEAYWTVVEPIGISRVIVRYINKITLPSGKNVRVEEYLNCAYLEIEGLPKQYANFLSRVEYVYEDKVRLLLSYGLLGESQNGLDCLLDMDVIWRPDETPIERGASLEIASDLHERAGLAFEAIVTDKARELLDAG